MVEWATEIKVRAERGERATVKDGGGMRLNLSHDRTSSVPTLSDLGLTRDESGRLSQIPHNDHERISCRGDSMVTQFLSGAAEIS